MNHKKNNSSVLIVSLLNFTRQILIYKKKIIKKIDEEKIDPLYYKFTLKDDSIVDIV